MPLIPSDINPFIGIAYKDFFRVGDKQEVKWAAQVSPGLPALSPFC